MSNIAVAIYLVLTTVGVILTCCRLLRGPSAADRLNAADLITISGVGITLAFGALQEKPAMMDIALVSSLILFFGTAVVAIVWRPEQLRGDGDD